MSFSESDLSSILSKGHCKVAGNKVDPLTAVIRKHGFEGAQPVKKPSKYRNTRVVTDEGTFDSKKEYQRWKELRMMEQAGQITNLERQRPFVIFPSVTLKGRKKPDAKYLADFSYSRQGVLVVEDVKSEATRSLPVYRLKMHAMKYLYNIEIVEI